MKLFLLACFGLLPHFQQRASIYTITCIKADGTLLALKNYKAKKILFVILPQESDTSFYQGLAAFQQKHFDSVNIIAVPAVENGYDSLKVQAIAKKVKFQNTVTMTATFTTKASGRQSPLLNWLTQKDKNGHYQVEKPLAGHKFFVDERGTLYGVIGPRQPLTAPLMDRIVRRPGPRNPAIQPKP